MTRDEYLSALKNEILALSSDEQAEALQYYSDYFDDANDDEKVIQELGSPAELGKIISEKFANAVVKTSSDSDSSSDNKDNCSSNEYDNGLFYSFNNDDVKNLALDFGIANVVLIKGDKYTVETRGIAECDLNCHLSGEGTLVIGNSRKIPLNFFSHDRSQRFVPRILITVPDGASLNKFELIVGAGQFRGKDCNFKCKLGRIEVGAGNLIVRNVFGGEIDFRCGMGNLEFGGSLTGRSNIDCGMGAVKMELNGSISDYSYDLKLGLGDVKINDKKHSGVYQSLNNPKKDKHFSINCGMGSVNIKIK